MEKRKTLKSGEFLVNDVETSDIFIPEEFDEEQKMIAQTCKDFLETELYPNLDKIDSPDIALMKSILKKAGELGLMGISLPEAYGGFGQSFITQMLAAEVIGAGHSFSVAFMAHCGIGTLPIMYYGNEDQRQRYVTKLATGEKLGAYCLTEPGAGSDANAGKTNAVLSEDGKHYILNGQKMWITNAGLADVLTVFAKIGNDRVLSAFIVERNYPGVVVNPDEKKMGIKGSSTAQIFFNDVKVPVENLLGKRGEGFRIALSILHMGRIKLGANVLGAAKKAVTDSVKYANERKQFGVLISTFGAIKYKLAEQVIRTFALESAIYRASKDIDDQIEANKKVGGADMGKASIEGISHYAVEAAILKVYGSEVLDYVVDEAVQIHGGMGYSAEMAVERGYRDSRINRIFEGTNEINRLLVVDTAMKRAMKGDFDLFGEAGKLAADIENLRILPSNPDYYSEKRSYIKNFKKVVLLVIHGSSEKFGKQLVQEQEVLNNITNMIIETYVSESLALRVQKMEHINATPEMDIYREILNVNVYDASEKVRKNAYDAIYSYASREKIPVLLKAVDTLVCVEGINVRESRRKIAGKLIADNTYQF